MTREVPKIEAMKRGLFRVANIEVDFEPYGKPHVSLQVANDNSNFFVYMTPAQAKKVAHFLLGAVSHIEEHRKEQSHAK